MKKRTIFTISSLIILLAAPNILADIFGDVGGWFKGAGKTIRKGAGETLEAIAKPVIGASGKVADAVETGGEESIKFFEKVRDQGAKGLEKK